MLKTNQNKSSLPGCKSLYVLFDVAINRNRFPKQKTRMRLSIFPSIIIDIFKIETGSKYVQDNLIDVAILSEVSLSRLFT